MSRIALAVAGLLFLLYPAFRPWTDETTAAGALEAMGSNAWVVSHLFAMVGFVLVSLALLGMREIVGIRAVAVTWAGAGLTLPYYGAEDFGLHAAATKGSNLLAVAEAVRYNPFAVTSFAVGLILLGVGAVLVAVAVWRSGTVAKYSGFAFAAGFVLFLPQFFTPAPFRIAHGVLMLVGLVGLAIAAAPAKAASAPRPALPTLSGQGAA
ncbi:hypothetical protein [Actinophytocola sp.]|uniref:hypothetical protein n=1 Tax=Actinophytocola sp. TaxID=1872138 RepID=UPI002ED00BE3